MSKLKENIRRGLSEIQCLTALVFRKPFFHAVDIWRLVAFASTSQPTKYLLCCPAIPLFPNFLQPVDCRFAHSRPFRCAFRRIFFFRCKDFARELAGVFQHDVAHMVIADMLMRIGKSGFDKTLLQLSSTFGRRPYGVRFRRKKQNWAVRFFEGDRGRIFANKVGVDLCCEQRGWLHRSQRSGFDRFLTGISCSFASAPPCKASLCKGCKGQFFAAEAPAGCARWVVFQ